MKFILTELKSELTTSEIILNDFSIMSDLIKQGLFAKYKTEEEVTKKIKEFQSKLFPNIHSFASKKDQDLKQVIHDFCYNLFSKRSSVFFNTASDVANSQGSNIVRVINEMNKAIITENDNVLRSARLFEKEASSYLIKELMIAFDKGIISKYKNIRLIEALGIAIGKQEEPKEEYSDLYLFTIKCNELLQKNELSNIVFEEADLSYEYKDILSNLDKIPYKEILLSKNFHDYLKDDSVVVDDMNELIETYLDDMGDFDLSTEFNKTILERKNKDQDLKIDLNRIKNINFVTNGERQHRINLFDIMEEKIEKEVLNDLIYLKSY